MITRAVTAAAVPPLEPLTEPPGASSLRASGRQAGDLAATGVGPLAAVSARPAGDPLSLAGLPAAVEEARVAALAGGDGPADPATFAALRSRLARAAGALPPAYRRAVAVPLLRALDAMGARGFARLLAQDPERVGAARLLLDVSQAVLQHGEGHQARATAAFQEVVSDLYDGFLSAEDRRGVKPPEHGVLPPLVRWGSGDGGPYTWPVTATATLDVGAAVVSLPELNATGGLLAWPALAHETAGHDILAADEGLRDELAGAVRERLLAAKMGTGLADYWSERIDETAADVLGVLDMGPAAAVGLIGYFRALNGAWHGRSQLRNVGLAEDPHPADIARAYVAAETVRLLSFQGAGRWADRLVAEADRDLGQIRLGDLSVSAPQMKAIAAAVAQAIVRTRLGALEGRALGEIQDWRDEDEAIAATLRQELARGGRRPAGKGAGLGAGTYAAHAVAAAVYEAVGGGSRPDEIMGRMVGLLAAMHARNPAWGGEGPAADPAGGSRVA
jgi:hypothetical protein